MSSETRDQRLHEWLTKHESLLLKIVRSFSFTPHDHEDLFQEIVFQLWRSSESYRSEKSAETTWIYRIGLNTAITWSRKEKTRQEKNNEFRLVAPLLNSNSRPGDARLEWLYEQISRLNSIDRSLTLMMLDGFSYQEISATLGISVSHVGVKLNRIKKQLTQRARENAHEF